jgi:hypothetical protein
MTNEARRYVDEKSDLDARVMRPSTILQALSPALAPDSDWPDAKAGDFLLSYEDGSEELVPRVPGVTLQPIAFVQKAMEWPAERGSKSAPIAAHDFVPLDAEWIDVGGRKACLRPGGTRIEKTIFAHALVKGFKTTFAFKSTAYDVGDRFGRDADKTRVEVDGEVVRVCGALYQLTSELERNPRGQTWYGPRYTKLGVLGQEGGPTIEQVRAARDLRFEFKAEEEARKKERAALSALKPTPALPRGSISITSGIERSRSWADPRGPAEIADPKPMTRAPAPIDDDIPF